MFLTVGLDKIRDGKKKGGRTRVALDSVRDLSYRRRQMQINVFVSPKMFNFQNAKVGYINGKVWEACL
jgi:hypothetical protein